MRKKSLFFWFFALIISLVPVIFIVIKVWTGAFAFWYDPARDMLSAWDNLSKPTLIGPTSGIPGIFYGPYWIWILSIGELISHDPRWVDFFAMTIPYVVVFPLLLFLFKGVFDKKILFLLWLLFILGYSLYAYSLWNPYPAPVLFLLFVVLLLQSDFNSNSIRQHLVVLVTGFSLGILANFHLSFGIGAVFGSAIYLVVQTFFEMKKNKKMIVPFFKNRCLQTAVFALGFVIAFSPFFLFELRHDFTQTKTFINAFTHFGGVVQTTGLTKMQIIQEFFGRLATLLQTPLLVSCAIFFLGVFYIFFKWKTKEITFSDKKKKLILILVSIAVGVLALYFTAKNPIWNYHFIGVEIIFLLSIGIILQKSRPLQILSAFWIVYLLISFSITSFQSISIDPKTVSGNVVAEKKVVEKVNANADGKDYTVFVYSPSIYSYDYSYLFRYLYNKDVPYRPELNPTDSSLVYIVFPPQVKSSIYTDFIHYRTPVSEYKTVKQWTMPSGSTIIKREKSK